MPIFYLTINNRIQFFFGFYVNVAGSGGGRRSSQICLFVGNDVNDQTKWKTIHRKIDSKTKKNVFNSNIDMHTSVIVHNHKPLRI